MFARRDLLRGGAALAAGVAAPALAQGPAPNRVLRFIPHADLSSIDPIGTTGYVVRNHGYLVYDTLYSLDSQFRPRPQMAEGHEVSADGRTYTIRLREGLRFHDGEPVRAADCVASLRRWAARDGFGQTLMTVTDEMPVVDDRTFQFRLKRPFPLLLEAIGKPSSPVPFIMPERVAQTSATQQIRDATGSGPFRFLRDEWVPGSRATYARHEGYVPRGEPLDGAAGGKVVHFDRIEWLTIPDPATAAAAIQRGEVDWYEQPIGDLVPILRRNRDINVTTYDPIGAVVLLRFNHLHPPFDNPRIRRAVLAAVNQVDYMTAMVGDPSMFRECKAFFPCGTPMSTGTGNGAMIADLDRARAMLRESGYAGEKVTVISPTDLAYLHAIGEVTNDLLRRLGMNVDFIATDWGSVLARRANMEAPERGGWNIFHTTAVGIEFASPAAHLALRGSGRAAWPGWPTNATLEALRQEWIDAPSPEAQRAIAARMEAEAFDAVPYAPLGQYTIPTALRRNLTGLTQASAPFVWNLRKA
jgi:peptide/nickel transport system substrate-binding protein